jgi:phytoene dehydrogenase-like protein
VAAGLIENGQIKGVRIANGEQYNSPIVISNADPYHTLIDLVGPQNLDLRVVRRLRNIRFHGSTTKINLALEELPKFNGGIDVDSLKGYILVSPSLDYIERAYDDAKYGRISSQPVLEIVLPSLLDPALAPPGKHLMSIRLQYTPYRLKEGGWDASKDRVLESTLAVLEQYTPGLSDLVSQSQVLTPLALETDFSLTRGGSYHGQMAFDQLAFMRPIPGYGRYRMPVDGLYLCGAGAHPGGGVTGAPGFNAAREVLADWG